MLDWLGALELNARIGISLMDTVGITDVNLRVAVDALSTVYLIGLARTEKEFQKTVHVSAETEGVGVIVNYVEAHP